MLISERIFDLMSDQYDGQSETEHLIKQAAHEIQISPLVIKAATAEAHIGSYSVTFKNRHGDDCEVFIPFDAGFSAIHAALKFAYAPKPKHDPDLKL